MWNRAHMFPAPFFHHSLRIGTLWCCYTCLQPFPQIKVLKQMWKIYNYVIKSHSMFWTSFCWHVPCITLPFHSIFYFIPFYWQTASKAHLCIKMTWIHIYLNVLHRKNHIECLWGICTFGTEYFHKDHQWTDLALNCFISWFIHFKWNIWLTKWHRVSFIASCYIYNKLLNNNW